MYKLISWKIENIQNIQNTLYWKCYLIGDNAKWQKMTYKTCERLETVRQKKKKLKELAVFFTAQFLITWIKKKKS